MSKSVLIIGKDGLSSALAYALKRDGTKVGVSFLKEETKSILHGIVEHVEDWEKEKDNYDMLVFEDTGFGERADELKKDGYVVVGASGICDKLENDRKFATEIATKYMDVRIPQTEEFDNWDDGLEFLSKNSDRNWVIKFNGLAGNHKDLLYVSECKGNQDLIELIKFYRDHWNSKYGEVSFVLQERINGTEVGVSGYFNGKRFVMPYYINKEYKKHLAGDVGVMTGQEGEIQYWTYKKTKIFNITLKRLEELLAENGYVGMFNVNGILNEEGYWFLEFTPRFGYNSQAIEIEYFRLNGYRPLDWMDANELQCTPSWMVGFLVTVPPYPHDSDLLYETVGKGLPIFFEDGKIPDCVYLHDVEYDGENFRTAGSVGYVLTVVGSGETSEDARLNALEVLKKIYIPKKQYRVDVGSQHGLKEVLNWK